MRAGLALLPGSTREWPRLWHHEIRRGSTIAFSSSVRFEARKGTLVPRKIGVVSTEVCFPTISKDPHSGVLELVSPFRPKRGHWKGPRTRKGDTTSEDSTDAGSSVPFWVPRVSPHKVYMLIGENVLRGRTKIDICLFQT